MSKRVSVIITDDLDGSQNAETVLFGFDGVTYEVDLGRRTGPGLRRLLPRSSRLAGGCRVAAVAVPPVAQVAHRSAALTCGPGPAQLV